MSGTVSVWPFSAGISAGVEIIGRQTNPVAAPLPFSPSGKSRADAALGVSMSAAAEAWMNVRRCIEPSIAVSAPIPWYFLE
jgi:hypothetical protein